MKTTSMRGPAVALAMLLPLSLTAQQSVTLTSIGEARRVIDQMVAAVGGRDALRAVRTFVSEETIRKSSGGQGVNPRAPGVVEGFRAAWVDIPGQRINELRTLDITGNQLWDVQRFITRNGTTTVSWSSMTKNVTPAAQVPRERTAFGRRYFLPFLIGIQSLPVNAARSLGTATVDGKPQDVLAVTDADGAQLTLFVDRGTHLPTRIEGLVISPAVGDTVEVISFSDYRRVGSLLLPHRRTERRHYDTDWEYRAERLAIDTPLADSLFAVPAGLSDETPPLSGMVKLAPDVYLVPNPYESVFVVFDDYVLVLEAGGSNGDSRNTFARIREVAPNKPVKYVVATHYHDDHLAGLRPFIMEGVTIVTTADARGRVEEIARARSQLNPDTLDRARRAPIIEIVDRARVFKDAHHEVQLHQIGPNAHVDQMLVAYLPAERILFEGDMVDMNGGQPAAGGDDTADFVKKVRALGLAFDRVVPVHGEPFPAADVEKSLRRGVARAKCPLGSKRRAPCIVD